MFSSSNSDNSFFVLIGDLKYKFFKEPDTLFAPVCRAICKLPPEVIATHPVLREIAQGLLFISAQLQDTSLMKTLLQSPIALSPWENHDLHSHINENPYLSTPQKRERLRIIQAAVREQSALTTLYLLQEPFIHPPENLTFSTDIHMPLDQVQRFTSLIAWVKEHLPEQANAFERLLHHVNLYLNPPACLPWSQNFLLQHGLWNLKCY